MGGEESEGINNEKKKKKGDAGLNWGSVSRNI